MLLGKLVHHYRLLEPLGGGGMGVVYRADDLKLGRHVALKFLPFDSDLTAEALARFHLEARAASALNHPNIRTIYEINDFEGRPYMAMELVEGRTLHEVLHGGPLPVALLLEWAIALADALDLAHHHGVVHRDIKPANIFITNRNEPKLLDFGLAKFRPVPARRAVGMTSVGGLDTDSGGMLTSEGHAVGTVPYISPEQARGKELDGRSDLFSFGAVLYEMATGRQAFDGPTQAVVFDLILNQAPADPREVNPQLPSAVAHIVLRLLEKKPEARYQSAAEVRADLLRARKELDALPTGRYTAPFTPTPSAPRLLRSVSTRMRLGVSSRRVVFLSLAAIAGAAATAAFFYFRMPHNPALTERDSIVLADITNRTGQPVFDGTLRQALAVKLAESPFLDIVPEARMRSTLRLMSRSPDETPTREIATEVCQRLGVKAIVAGELARVGTQYVLLLDATECASGRSLAREQTEATRQEEVLRALSNASTKLRRDLGESLASVERHNRPLEEATTSSLEALKSYTSGVQARFSGRDQDAIPFFRRAIELDPDFAIAHARLGVSYGSLGETRLADQHRVKAYELRERASEREKFYIMGQYYFAVERDPRKAVETYELWARTYPRDATPHNNLGVIYSRNGQLEDARREYELATKLNPEDNRNMFNLSLILIRLREFETAKAVLREVLRRTPGSAAAHVNLYQIAVLQEDEAEMERQAAFVRGKEEEADLLEVQAAAASRGGRFREMRKATQLLVAMHLRNSMPETATLALAYEAAVHAMVGLQQEARAAAAEVMKKQPNAEARVLTAFALSVIGDSRQAESLVAGITEAPFADPAMRFLTFPALRASVALGRGDVAGALKLLDEAAPHVPQAGNTGVVTNYLRGLALLHLRRGEEAGAEFRKVIDRRGITLLDTSYPVIPAAQLGLARAQALAGGSEARASYEAFFQHWKNADPDVPMLREARAEYNRLK